MHMDDTKIFTKNGKEWETLIQVVRIYCHDMGMKFNIEICDMLMMRSGQGQLTERTEQPNQEKSKTLGEKENYMYLGIQESDTIK